VGPAGDADGDGVVSAADLAPALAELFDRDGLHTRHRAAQGGNPPVTMDANADTLLDAADIAGTLAGVE